MAVQTARVQQRDLVETLLLTGEIESPMAVEVFPKAQGRLEKLALPDGQPVVEGVRVRRGEVIAELDHRELEARLALARAQARQAEVLAFDRERERRRLEALFAGEVATEQAREAAVAAHENALAALAQAQAQVRLAEVNLDEAFIRAPMDGVVAGRRVDPGAMVGPSVSIVRIVQMDPLKLILAVPVRHLPLLVEGQTQVTVTTGIYPEREYTCTLERIHPVVDPATRTVRTETLLPNSVQPGGGWTWRPGMYATAALTLAERPGALVIPAAAVIRILDRQIVFTLDGDIARATEVQTGWRDGDDLEIVSGLAAGQEYVVLGQNKLTEGTPVRRVEAAAGP